ncbi:MAG: hypothetical protein K2X35_11775 [Bryobacteraceae bacterium]|nr:hypothetical protein [Bryobacteraceae bacterium]
MAIRRGLPPFRGSPIQSPSGYNNLAHVFVLFHTALVGVNGCYVYYSTSAGQLFLRDDAGEAWLGPVSLGSSNSASNSACTMHGAGSSASGSGNQLQLFVNLTFSPQFAGAKNHYVKVYNLQGLYSDWQQYGTWTVTSGQQYLLTTSASPAQGGSVTPVSNWYPSGQVVQVTATANNGYQFAGFSGAISGSAPSQFVTMDGNKSIVASFLKVIPQSFRDCISVSGGSSCILPPGAYWVSQTLQILRPNITVGGTGAMGDLKLVRHPSFTGLMISIGQFGAQPIQGVKIQNLTVCGGSDITPGGGPAPPSEVGCPRMPTDCGERTKEITRQGDSVPPNLVACSDVSVESAALASPPASPFTSPPSTYAVEFDRVDLEDAAGHALVVRGYVGVSRADDIYFHHGSVRHSGVTGILYGVDPVSYLQKDCDKYLDQQYGFANDPTVYLPRNLRIEHNELNFNNTGAMGGAARWVGLRSNTFLRNYLWPQAQGPMDPTMAFGGTVEFDACSDQVEIIGNEFTGPGDDHVRTSGLELYARNLLVRQNSMASYRIEGIAATGVAYGKIAENPIHYTSVWHNDGAIRVGAYGPGRWCSDQPLDIPRDTFNVTLTGNVTSGQAFGVLLQDHPWRGTGVLRNVTICQDWSIQCSSGTNSLGATEHSVHMDPFVWANATNGYAGPQPFRAAALLETPRSLAVDVGSSSLCAPSGANRGLFTITGSDNSSGSSNVHPNLNDGSIGGPNYGEINYTGAKQIYTLEATFSVLPPESNGPSNTSQDCHLVYFPDLKTVYLDIPGPSGEITWGAGSSIVGPGGRDLASPGCIVHAGASPSPPDPLIGEYAASVKLDIEFIGATGKRHVYAYTLNKVNQSSKGWVHPLTWRYWGWWHKP